MKNTQILIDSIDKVKAFVNEIARFDCDFDLISGRYVIDAKSIMGIFSLDISKPIELDIHVNDESEAAEIMKALQPYLAG
ncbi:MAG: HPr family phosphocarrier protein [Lachnospiraceae bacterium]|nr:HPr family phosphocarrier protein [Lachnospiraceae bacterium]MBQ9867310.1 HPr family phosphocarrier protein [Lachnospiraceae bacterium]